MKCNKIKCLFAQHNGELEMEHNTVTELKQVVAGEAG